MLSASPSTNTGALPTRRQIQLQNPILATAFSDHFWYPQVAFLERSLGDRDWQAGGLLGRALEINTCGKEEKQGSRIGQMKNLALIKALAEPRGSSKAGLALEDCPKLQWGPFTSMLSSRWMTATHHVWEGVLTSVSRLSEANSKAAGGEASASSASSSWGIYSVLRRELGGSSQHPLQLTCNNINAKFLSNQKLCCNWEKKRVFCVCVWGGRLNLKTSLYMVGSH